MSITRTCSKCQKVRNTKLHFNGKCTTCKECISDKYFTQLEQQKEAELQQTITAHYALY